MNYKGPNVIDDDRPGTTTYVSGSLPEAFQLIESLSRKLKNLHRQTTSSTGLTPPQFVVLRALEENDEQPLKDLAVVAQCTRATITGVVDVLERKRLVERRPNPADRRSLLVGLTNRGRSVVLSTPGLESLLHGCCSGLSPEDTAHLVDLLTRLDDSLAAWTPNR